MPGNQLPNCLSMENPDRRTGTVSLIHIGVNVALNVPFVQVLRLEAFGLALASSLGLGVFFDVQAQAFPSGRTSLRLKGFVWKDSLEMVRIGLPVAASTGCQAVRSIIVNHLLEVFVGSAGISAFAASDNLLRIFRAVPTGMLAVSRRTISISVGEEDRETLADVMRIMLMRFVPLMRAISAAIILCAEPFTRVFFRDPSAPVCGMTVRGFRILPLSSISTHFAFYGRTSGRQGPVHVLSPLDGVVCVAGFPALLIRWLGINGVYIANVLNGIVCLAVILLHSRMKTKRFPTNMEQLMVIPDDFGAEPDARIDIRVVHRGDDIMLRIRDDCVPFNPRERRVLTDSGERLKNAGIRIVCQIARSVEYQNLLGLNVLTLRI